MMKFSDMLKNKKNNNVEEPVAGDNAQNEQEQVVDPNTASGGDANVETPQPDETAEKPSVEDTLRADLAEANNKFLRLYAEFENYKRRTIKERSELLQTAGKDVLQSLLPVLDDFERAMKAMENTTEIAPVKEGVSLVHNKLKTIMSQKGVKEMEAIGTAFDPDVHEAITNIPAPNEEMKGKVIDQVEKGYYLNDKVIRFAKVVVGN